MVTGIAEVIDGEFKSSASSRPCHRQLQMELKPGEND